MNSNFDNRVDLRDKIKANLVFMGSSESEANQKSVDYVECIYKEEYYKYWKEIGIWVASFGVFEQGILRYKQTGKIIDFVIPSLCGPPPWEDLSLIPDPFKKEEITND